MSQRTIITGGSGIIGRRLSAELLAAGHEVIILSRNPATARPLSGVRAVGWDARTAEGWGELADGANAIINLAGENIGSDGLIPLPGTWSQERKQRIMHSRRDAGQAVVAAVEAAREKPRVVVQMSGIDYYPSANTVMTEESQRGRQFLADVVADYGSRHGLCRGDGRAPRHHTHGPPAALRPAAAAVATAIQALAGGGWQRAAVVVVDSPPGHRARPALPGRT
jgi:hypothetical protein